MVSNYPNQNYSKLPKTIHYFGHYNCTLFFSMGDVNEKHIRSVLNQQLIATGEKEKLLDLLKVKLIECGWRNEVGDQGS